MLRKKRIARLRENAPERHISFSLSHCVPRGPAAATHFAYARYSILCTTKDKLSVARVVKCSLFLQFEEK